MKRPIDASSAATARMNGLIATLCEKGHILANTDPKSRPVQTQRDSNAAGPQREIFALEESAMLSDIRLSLTDFR